MIFRRNTYYVIFCPSKQSIRILEQGVLPRIILINNRHFYVIKAMYFES